MIPDFKITRINLLDNNCIELFGMMLMGNAPARIHFPCINMNINDIEISRKGTYGYIQRECNIGETGAFFDIQLLSDEDIAQMEKEVEYCGSKD